MKLIKAIVRPNKVDDVKDALEKLSISGHDRHRGARPRQAEGPHRDLPRQGIQRQPAAEDGDRSRRPRRHRSTTRSRRSSRRRAPAKSATAACSSCRSSRATASAPANGARCEVLAGPWCLCLLLPLAVVRAQPAAGAVSGGAVTQTDLAKLDQRVTAAQSSADNAWMLVSAALVLMMTGPGLALFYGGLVRQKNMLATMMQSFVLMALVTVLWALVGYSLCFGEGIAVHRRVQPPVPARRRRRAQRRLRERRSRSRPSWSTS